MLFIRKSGKNKRLWNPNTKRLSNEDDGYSGTNFNRPGFQRMLADIKAGRIKRVIVKDMSRFGRDYLQVGTAMEIFRRNNVRFIAVNNGIDSEKPDTLEFAPFIIYPGTAVYPA